MRALIIQLLTLFLCLSPYHIGANAPKKIIGLMPVKNEAYIVKQALIALSKITDGIIVLDDCSTDNTLQEVQSVKTSCTILEIIEKKEWYRDESGDKNKLLKAGRSHGGTHFIVVDADEII